MKRISLQDRHVIFENRQKKPAGYGFYFPAKNDPEDEINQSITKVYDY
jgi:hypothetical protein